MLDFFVSVTNSASEFAKTIRLFESPERFIALTTCSSVFVASTAWLIRSCFPKKKKKILDDSCPSFSEIPDQIGTEDIDAAWPPSPHPVEALPVRELIAANGKLIRDLCHATTLTEEECQEYLLPAITNLARIVHLVPASEYDHHQGYGGLFTHSLEVAYYAANEAKTTVFDRSASPEKLHHNKRRWILTSVLAALVHDIGKPFTDMNISTEDGQHWPQDEPILDWLRKNKVERYFISFRPGREHNQHKAAALEKSSLLIPKKTLGFIGEKGFGEVMQTEFRNAILKGSQGGLIGRILDNADGQSRNMDSLRQRKIRPEFKNVAHPQGDHLLKAIRALIGSGKWTTNRDEKSRLFNTTQGCFLVWTAGVAAEAHEQAIDLGFVSLPTDSQKLASILLDAGAILRNTEDISNIHSIFWTINPILFKNTKFECIKFADAQLIYDGIAPSAVECIVDGTPISEETKDAWFQRWNFKPIPKLTREEQEEMGYTDDYIDNIIEEANAQESPVIDEAILYQDFDENTIPIFEEGNPDEQIQDQVQEHNLEITETEIPVAPKEFTDEDIASLLPEDELETEKTSKVKTSKKATEKKIKPSGIKKTEISLSDIDAEPDNFDDIDDAVINQVMQTESIDDSFEDEQAQIEAELNETIQQIQSGEAEREAKEEAEREQKCADESQIDVDALMGGSRKKRKSEAEHKKEVAPRNERISEQKKKKTKKQPVEPIEDSGNAHQEEKTPPGDNVSGETKNTSIASLQAKIATQEIAANGLVDSMLKQLIARSGIWISDGMKTDTATSYLYTRSVRFENAIRQIDVDPDFVVMAIEDLQKKKVIPRMEWDQKGKRLILIDA